LARSVLYFFHFLSYVSDVQGLSDFMQKPSTSNTNT
jgi:hypothetical protein